MYAIVATGGKQYKVAKGDVISDKVKLDVLMLNDGKKVVADAATLSSKKVTCEVLEQYKDKKVLVFKFHKRKRYHRANGHRQNLTKLKVTTLPTARKAAAKASDESAE